MTINQLIVFHYLNNQTVDENGEIRSNNNLIITKDEYLKALKNLQNEAENFKSLNNFNLIDSDSNLETDSMKSTSQF